MRLDFVIETDSNKLYKFIDNDYCENNIVYTNVRNCITYPGKFYLIPNAPPQILPIAMIIYLAAFDGHQEIFLLGYNVETPVDSPRWIDQVGEVMDAYSKVKFFVPGIHSNIPKTWLDRSNCETMTYQEFISYCDV